MNATPRWGAKDFMLCAAVALGAAWLAAQAGENLSYRWNWQAAWGYVIAGGETGFAPGLLLSGFAASIRLLVLAGILSLLFGGVLAAALLSPFRAPAVVYVEAMRNTPPLVFMFIFFYFIGGGAFDFIGAIFAESDSALLKMLIGDPRLAGNFFGGAVCLALFECAFFAEVLRAGILSVERGQWEAAKSAGLGRWQILRFVILPQALKNTAAPLVGQLIFLVKDSAILSVISVQELTFAAQEASVSSRQIFEVWLLAAALYFAICWPMLRFADKLEKRKT